MHTVLNGNGKATGKGKSWYSCSWNTISQLPSKSLEYLGSRSGDPFAKVGCLRAEGTCTCEVIREEAGVYHS